ncbi:MAG: tripartite tricarboxylate transporter substrate binding protein [Burkholderiales bacterium]
MSMSRRDALALLGGIVAATATGVARAADYPAKPIRLVVPFPPGGASDVIARMTAAELQATLKQSVVVDNKPGANGIIGVEAFLQAPADGYTLLAAGGSAWTPAQVKDLKFNVLKDCEPIALVCQTPLGLIVPAQLPVNTAQEFFAYVKKSPGKYNYASVAPNDLLWTELLKYRAGLDIVQIAYKGNAPALTALLTNEVQMTLSAIAVFLPHIKEGKLKVLAVTTAQRSPVVPDVPTLAEVGVTDFVTASTNGAWAPKGTPKDVVQKLNATYDEFLQRPQVKAMFLEKLAAVTLGGTPEELRRVIGNDQRSLDEAAKLINYQPA